MIGIALCLGLSFSCNKPYSKALLIFACAVQFLFLSLTNCRTSILMTCALVGGIFFFGIYRGGWLRSVLYAFLALLLMLGLFVLSGTLYDANETALIEKYTNQLESESEEQAPAASVPSGSVTIPVKTDSQTGEVTLEAVNGQGSFMSDLKTLNGRTIIWRSALNALQDNSRILLFGTEYVVPVSPITIPSLWFTGITVGWKLPSEWVCWAWFSRWALPGLACVLPSL